MRLPTLRKPATGPEQAPDFGALLVEDATDQLATARRKVVRLVAGISLLATATLLIVVLTMTSAADEVKLAALATGTFRSEFSATWLDPVVGLTIVTLMFAEALIVEAGRVVPWGVRVVRWICGAATFLMMVVPPLAITTPTPGGREWTPNFGGAGFHALYPLLLIGSTELAPVLLREMTAALADVRGLRKRVIEAELGRRKTEAVEAARVDGETAAATHARKLEEQRVQQAAERERLQQERWAIQDAAERDRQAADLRRREKDEDVAREKELIEARTAAAEREAAAAAERARPEREAGHPRTGGGSGGPRPRKRLPSRSTGTTRDRVLAHLRQGPDTRANIAEAIGASSETVKPILTALTNEGLVEQDPDMPRGWRARPTLAVAQ